jgi:hypothetical protein
MAIVGRIKLLELDEPEFPRGDAVLSAIALAGGDTPGPSRRLV